MAAKIVVEAIVYSLVYSVFMLGLFKVQGARKQLYNYPPAIQKRAIERGITTQEEMNANAKRNKVIGLIGMIVLSIVITCGVNKQYTLGQDSYSLIYFLTHFHCLMHW